MHNLLTTFQFRDKLEVSFLAVFVSFLQLLLAIGLTYLTDQIATLDVFEVLIYIGFLFFVCCFLAFGKWQMDRIKNQRMLKRKIQEQELLLQSIYQIPLLQLESKGEGNLLEMLTGDTETIARFLEVRSVEFLVGISGCFFGIFYGAFYSWKLLLFVLLFMGISYFLDQHFTGCNQSFWEKRLRKRDLLSQRVVEILKASKLLRIHRANNFSRNLFQNTFKEYSQADIQAEKANFRLQAFGVAKSLMFDSTFLFFSLWLILQKEIQIGAFLGFNVILQNIIWMFYYFPGMLADYGQFCATKARLDTCLYEAKKNDNTKDFLLPALPSKIKKIAEEDAERTETLAILECRDVTFTYPCSETPVLKNFSLVMKKNPPDKIFLTGSSGTGKSTFLKVLLGLYPIHTGQIIMRAKHLGYVSQNTPLFKDTLRNNLLMGREVNDEVLWNLIDQVHLRSVLQHVGGDLNFVVSQEIESNLSSGEIQKIGLVRALIQADFLVMDEPFANLDSQSEMELSNILREIEIPVLLTSHRNAFLSTEFHKVEFKLDK